MSDELNLDQIQNEYPRHNIEKKIAEGGQKDVYKGEFDGQEIVLKPLVVETWEEAKRAELEIQAMEEISSPILVDLLQSFQDKIDGHELFVMVEEFIPGITLKQYLNQYGPNIEMALEVGATILEVLNEFDEKGFIHRDIKPTNIMIEPDDDIRLLDVGVARSPEDTDITPTGRNSAPGTPGYRSPEQMENDQDRQDTRTDLFALGIVMFETMTLSHPFAGQEIPLQEAIQAGTHDQLSDHIEIPSEYEGLEAFVNRLIEKKMHRRFNNPEITQEFLQEIK